MKFRIKLITGLVVASLIFVFPIQRAQADAEADIAIAIAKFAAELIAKEITRAIYNDNCKDQNLVSDIDSLVCGALGSFSGEAEAQWKKGVTDSLNKIQAAVDRIEQGLSTVINTQRELLQKSDKVLVRLDDVSNETVITDALTDINTIWDDQYEPMINQERDFSRERLLAFARSIIFEKQLDLKIGKINQALTRSNFGGRKTLLASFISQMDSNLLNVSAPIETLGRQDLTPILDYTELVLTEIFTQQRKGYIMYIWAAGILQSECEINQQCADKAKLPHTTLEYQVVFNKHLRSQLEAYNHGLEAIILKRSDYNSIKANFLHPDTEKIFKRIDIFAAANLNENVVSGRVFAMGKQWDGKLSINKETISPLKKISTIPVLPNIYKGQQPWSKVDWWTASKPKTQIYDTVHTAKNWTVYHYRLKDQTVGKKSINTLLPYRPAIDVKYFDLMRGTVTNKPSNSTIMVGSFTAIQRAGGGYAMLSSNWTKGYPVATSSGGSGNKNSSAISREMNDTNPAQIVVHSSGNVTNGVRKAHYITTLTRNHKIRFADNHKVRLFTQFQSDSLGTLGDGIVIRLKTNYVGTDTATLSARTGLSLTGYNSDDGVVVTRELKTSTNKTISHAGTLYKNNKDLNVVKNQQYDLILFSDVNVNVPSFFTGLTSFIGSTALRLDNAHIGIID